VGTPLKRQREITFLIGRFRKASTKEWNWLTTARFWGRPDYCWIAGPKFSNPGLWIFFQLTPLETQRVRNLEQPICRPS